MRDSRVFLLALGFTVLLSALAWGQTTAPAADVPKPDAQTAVKIDNNFVHERFGDQFTLVPEIGVMIGDLDGDGIDDAAIAARCKNPLLDEAAHDYRVLDPYYEFFGYGDPKVTTSFSKNDPSNRGLVVLVIHGTGPEAWRSATPKAKYVIINLPYRGLSVRKMRLGKKLIGAIYAEEGTDMGESSALYFDKKTYKYVPMGSNME
jgi:hypothetical protein